jgi:predicted GNAT family N-acyltransferase
MQPLDGENLVLLPPLPCRAERILQLRRDVFFPGQSIQQARYPGDDDPRACHFAGCVRYANDRAEHLVACTSLLVDRYEGEPAWRVRGLCVAEGYRGMGIGGRFMQEVARRICLDTPVHVMWCAAKEDAHGFFERLGWQMVDEVYLLQGSGTHFCRVPVE